MRNSGRVSIDIQSSYLSTGIYPFDKNVWKSRGWCLEDEDMTKRKTSTEEQLTKDKNLIDNIRKALESGEEITAVANKIREAVTEDDSFFVFLAKKTVIAEKESDLERKKRLVKRKAPRLSSGGRGFLVQDSKEILLRKRVELMGDLQKKESELADVRASMEGSSGDRSTEDMVTKAKEILHKMKKKELKDMEEKIQKRKDDYLLENPSKKRAPPLDKTEKDMLENLKAEVSQGKKEWTERHKKDKQCKSERDRMMKEVEKLEKAISVMKKSAIYREKLFDDGDPDSIAQLELEEEEEEEDNNMEIIIGSTQERGEEVEGGSILSQVMNGMQE